MDDLTSEKEQIEQMRSWWTTYGNYVIAGVVLAAVALFTVNTIQSKRLAAQNAGSEAYEELIVFVADGKLEDAERLADVIATEYSSTTYSGQAGLAMARLYMDKNRDQDAALALLEVIEGDVDEELKHVARLRLSRIYLYQDKAQDVVDLLADQNNAAFKAAYGEVLGDAYTALGRIAEAEAAYQDVLLDPLAQGTVDQQLVQWKTLDLPTVAETLDDATSTTDEAADAVESAE